MPERRKGAGPPGLTADPAPLLGTRPADPPMPEPNDDVDASEPERERTPRIHGALIIAGPLGLALAVVLSMWSSSQKILHSVDVQVDAQWQPGQPLALRTSVLGADLRPLERALAVEAELVDAAGTVHPLGSLTEVGTGLAQLELAVPAAATGTAELRLHYDIEGQPRFDEQVAVEVVERRSAREAEQVVAGNMLQWADDSDPQPDAVRIDLRFAGRLVAGFRNRVFVRVTDASGKPWAPADRDASVEVRLLSGEWAGMQGKPDDPPIVHRGPLDRLGLADFAGVLTSDVVRFEVRLPGPRAAAPASPPAAPPSAAPPTETPPTETPPTAAPPGPKRALRFVSHAGTVDILPETELARPGDTIRFAVDAISTRKPVFVDVHAPDGAWLATATPPPNVAQDREWTIPATLGEGLLQLEGYQSVSSPEQSSALARIQLSTLAPADPRSLEPLIAEQREQLSLPRVDKQFELAREQVYLDTLASYAQGKAAQGLDAGEVARVRSFLIGSLQPVAYGPPVALDTRAREVETLADFKQRWLLRIRWWLFGGGGLFIVLLAGLVWRHQRQFERHSSAALGLAEGPRDEEVFADQSLALQRARREIVGRGVITILLWVAMLIITIMMLEKLVWT